jgi:anaerobic selenocysteine-containing dehydrogenase
VGCHRGGGCGASVPLATSPARHFLNSTFTETSSSEREGRPSVMIHPEDAAALGVADGAPVQLGNAARRGVQVALRTQSIFDGAQARRGDRRGHLAERWHCAHEGGGGHQHAGR